VSDHSTDPKNPSPGEPGYPQSRGLFGDLKHPVALYAKGFLFLVAGAIAAAILLLEQPTWRTAALLAICVWCFCRAYYFAFYVIERYVDPTFRYAGLLSLARYWLRARRHVDKVSANFPPRDAPR
jgi:hypothetical protein